MRKIKSVVVLGAGIAGITAAYFEAMKGDQVYLIDTGDRAGGLLKSYKSSFGDFDIGTHVAGACGVKELDEFLFGGMDKEDFFFFNPGDAGSFFNGCLSEISPFLNTTSLSPEITKSGLEELLNIKEVASYTNLEEAMIGRFGITLYEETFKGVVDKLMGCSASELAPEMIYYFDMNRLIAFDRTITDKLKQVEKYNNVLGYHYPAAGLFKTYPNEGGIEGWIKFLMKKLEKAGVEFLPETTIKAVQTKNGKVTKVDFGKGTLNIDKLFWTIPSALFSRLVNPEKQTCRPKFRPTGLYDFSFLNPLKSDCFYINVYDTNMLSARVTLYQNLKNENKYYSCTVEVLNGKDFDFSNASDTILEELKIIGLVDSKNPCVFKNTRVLTNGFPILDNSFNSSSMALLKELKSSYSNVCFLGRGNGKFFMREILQDTYESTLEKVDKYINIQAGNNNI